MNEYLNFDLYLYGKPGSYTAKVIHSAAGEPSIDITLPYSLVDLRMMPHPRSTQATRLMVAVDSRTGSELTPSGQELGEQLFGCIFKGAVGNAFSVSQRLANDSGKKLRLRLRLADVPELINIPWELLYNPDRSEFFALSEDTPLVRYLDLPLAHNRNEVLLNPPLRILLMVADVQGYPRLDVRAEEDKLRKAIKNLEEQGEIELVKVSDLTTMQEELLHQDYHIFHFIGHGDFDGNNDAGVLLMQDRDRSVHRVTGRTLGTMLHNEHSLRLAILNSCMGAQTSLRTPFSGVAQSLVKVGLPAVIAMQYQITDHAAITFSQRFYEAIARRESIDIAVVQARHFLVRDDSVEWATPVTYLRANDGLLIPKVAGSVQPQKPKIAEPPPIPPGRAPGRVPLSCKGRPAWQVSGSRWNFLVTDQNEWVGVSANCELHPPLPNLSPYACACIGGRDELMVGLYTSDIVRLRDKHWEYLPQESAILAFCSLGQNLLAGTAAGGIVWAEKSSPHTILRMRDPIVALATCQNDVVALGSRGMVRRIRWDTADKQDSRRQERQQVETVSEKMIDVDLLQRPAGLFDAVREDEVGIFSATRLGICTPATGNLDVSQQRFDRGIRQIVLLGGARQFPYAVLDDQGALTLMDVALRSVRPVRLPTNANASIRGFCSIGTSQGIVVWSSAGKLYQYNADGQYQGELAGDDILFAYMPAHANKALHLVRWNPRQQASVEEVSLNGAAH